MNLRFADYVTMAQDVVKVTSLKDRPLLPSRNTPGTHFYYYYFILCANFWFCNKKGFLMGKVMAYQVAPDSNMYKTFSYLCHPLSQSVPVLARYLNLRFVIFVPFAMTLLPSVVHTLWSGIIISPLGLISV